MPVRETQGLKEWQLRTPLARLLMWGGWLLGTAAFVYCWQLLSGKTIWMFVWDAPEQALDLAERMVPPKWSYLDSLWLPIWDTLNIATLGTVIALFIAVPVAFCAARNTTPSVLFVRPVALFIIVSSRSINSLIWALMLVTIIGPGVLAGVTSPSTVDSRMLMSQRNTAMPAKAGITCGTMPKASTCGPVAPVAVIASTCVSSISSMAS